MTHRAAEREQRDNDQKRELRARVHELIQERAVLQKDITFLQNVLGRVAKLAHAQSDAFDYDFHINLNSEFIFIRDIARAAIDATRPT
jgi:hypothetical protein